MSELKYKMEFSLGDPSGDGHRYCNTSYIRSNYSANDIDNIYKEACKKLGFDYVVVAASEYEDRTLDIKYVSILIEKGVITKDYYLIVTEEDTDYYGDKGQIFFDEIYDFIKLYFDIIKWAKPDFEWEYIPYEGNILWTLHGAGYGLF